MKIQPANRRLGILLSGRGSNFEAIADRIAFGQLNAEIGVVVLATGEAGIVEQKAGFTPSLRALEVSLFL